MKKQEEFEIIPADCPQHDILIDFSGWVCINAKKLIFLNLETMKTINGEEWIKLSDDDAANYVIEDIIAAIRDADDREWDIVDIVER